MTVIVLRLGHRIFRDKRITTHLFLTARAFGADRGYYTGEKDSRLEESIAKTASSWGGSFTIEHTDKPKQLLSSFRGKAAHLTVYGRPIEEKIADVRKEKGLLVIVGGEKVQPEYYSLADWNISVGTQPHSEVAALAIFLDRLFSGRQFGKWFPKARLKVVGMERGKKVIRL